MCGDTIHVVCQVLILYLSLLFALARHLSGQIVFCGMEERFPCKAHNLETPVQICATATNISAALMGRFRGENERTYSCGGS